MPCLIAQRAVALRSWANEGRKVRKESGLEAYRLADRVEAGTSLIATFLRFF